jgi:ABC-type glycerol-3-phosphate transport system permease component
MTTVDEQAAADLRVRGESPKKRGKAVRHPKGRSPIFDAPTPLGLTLRYATLALAVGVSVGPMLWSLSTSLKAKSEDVFSQTPQFLPAHPTLGNYHEVSRDVPIWHFATNSIIVAILCVGGNLVGTTLAGYALARLDFRFKKLVVALFMATLVLPGEATIISQYQVITNMGFGDTLLGVALPTMIGPVNVLLMRNAFAAIPQEVEDAAVIDGATVVQRLRYVGLPNVKGMLAVIAILTFIGAWDDFLWPLLVVQSPDKLTLTVGLSYLQGQFSADPRTIAAGTMIALVPILVLFTALQRHFFKGVGEGAVKG